MSHAPIRAKRRGRDDPISPPPVKRQRSVTVTSTQQQPQEVAHRLDGSSSAECIARNLPSPFTLTRIPDLPDSDNVDCVTLAELIGGSDLASVWIFDFLFDVPYILQHLSPVRRESAAVHLVHGFWRAEDEQRHHLIEQAAAHDNVHLHAAYVPSQWGTHHSKMLVIFYRDGTAHVIIHTANMVAHDWERMTQAAWISPRLQRLQHLQQQAEGAGIARTNAPAGPWGSGSRFKQQLLAYLAGYPRDLLLELRRRLASYSFDGVRAALVASVPGSFPRRHDTDEDSNVELWGVDLLGAILDSVPVSSSFLSQHGSSTGPGSGGTGESDRDPHVVAQISSVGSLGPTQDDWLLKFRRALSRCAPLQQSSSPVLSQSSSSENLQDKEEEEESQEMKQKNKKKEMKKPDSYPLIPFSIVFPTVQEIRFSLSGYRSGGSVHWRSSGNGEGEKSRARSSGRYAAQQLYLRPHLCRWTNRTRWATGDDDDGSSSSSNNANNSGRARAAPHIKTFIRFSRNVVAAGDSDRCDKTRNYAAARDAASSDAYEIDWALLTSANLSKAAWGSETKRGDRLHIMSYELGVLVWPKLWEDCSASTTLAKVKMAAVFRTQTVSPEHRPAKEVVVGLRVPYSLPLRRYEEDDEPWIATRSYTEPDCHGAQWLGWQT